MRITSAVRSCLAGLILAVLTLPAVVRAAPDPGETAQAVAASLDLQTQLPVAKPEAPELRDAPDAPGKPWKLTGEVAQVILYAALAVGIALVLYTLRDHLPSLGAPRLAARRPDAVAQAAAVERMVEAQIEADDLAGQGRYAEAMHALLLRSLTEMRRRLQVSFADSLTSREILRVLDLPELGKLALADLIRRVELVYFGLHVAGREDYTACRASYEGLTAAMAGAA